MKRIIKSFAALVSRAPALVVAGMLVMTAALGWSASGVQTATGQEGFAPNNPEIEASSQIEALFGDQSSETVMQVVVTSDSGDVLTAEALQAVSASLQALQNSPAAQYLSTTTERPQPFFSYLAPVQLAAQTQGIPLQGLDDAAVKNIYQQTLADPQAGAQLGFARQLVADKNGDGNPEAGLVLVFVRPVDRNAADPLNTQIEHEQAIADALTSVQLPSGLEIRPFSFSLLFGEGTGFNQEIGRLFAMAFGIIILILAFVYWMNPRSGWFRSIRRSLADMGVTMLTIVMAIVWMQGVGRLFQEIGWVGSFNEIAQIVPVLLIGLGVDYGIHLISRYREEVGTGASVLSAVRRAIGTTGIALALATLTTVIGFLTNVFSPLPALKDFGILAATGIVASFVLMLTFVPAIRLLLDRRAERFERLPAEAMGESSGERLLPKLMEKTAVLAERLPVATLLVALILGVLGYWGGFVKLETRFSFTDFLPQDSPMVQTLEVLNTEFGGGFGETTQVLVQGADLARPEVFNAIADVQRGFAAVPGVVTVPTPAGEYAQVTSPVSILQQLLAPGADGTPADPALAQQALSLGLQPDGTVAGSADVAGLWQLASQAAPEQMSGVIHADSSGATDAVLLTVGTQAGDDAGKLRDDLAAALTPLSSLDGVSAIATSQEIISSVVVDSLTSSQVWSLLATVAAATLVLIINFLFENRRPFLGVLTMIPVFLVVLWTRGIMFVSGIPLGPVTSTLTALAVGIGVPYTIHLARRFEEDRVRYDDIEDAIRSTTRHTGGALAGSAFTTAAGFGILMTSTLVPFQQMGLVTAYAIGLSLVGAVLVLPSLLVLWERWHRRRGHAAVEKATESAV